MKIKSIIINLLLSLILLPSLCNISFAVSSPKMVAITIDDLPFVGEYRNFHLNMIIETLTQQKVPATGFIIASEVHKENWEILRKFRDAGLELGSHTLTHANLGRSNEQQYIREIQEADTILSPVLTKPKYFRYPYLSMGNGKHKEDILCFLAKKNYHVAPVTIDSKDFVFNQRLLATPEIDRRAYLEELKPFYLDFIQQQSERAEQTHPNQAQILLIHANLLNAYVLPDIIKVYKQNGYKFVSLKEALNTFKRPMRCSKPQLHPQPEPQPKGDKDVEAFVEWD